MLNGDVFTIDFPTPNTGYDDSVDMPIADGCSTNTNYYTQGGWRGTCCCGCDKDVAY